jgi:hypothetical protein
MQEPMSITETLPEDIPSLIALKKAYLLSIYRGYFPEEALHTSVDEYCSRMFADWLENPDVCIASMKQGTTPKGYIAYGHKSGKQENGIIYDFGFADSVRQEEKASLIRWANDQVHSMGEAETGIWLIRDNLRARFLVESAGFHRHGDAREITRAGKSVTMVYYRDIRPQQVLQ